VSDSEAPGFFRYDHDAPAIGATRWLIGTAAYAISLTELPFSVRPFIEVQRFQVSEDSGDINPTELFGADSFWSLSRGGRIFIGGGGMRMGSYGILDPMATHSTMPGM
jgi:hypothetical protein